MYRSFMPGVICYGRKQGTYGYSLGGTDGTTVYVNCYRVTFSTGVNAAQTTGNLSQVRRNPGGLSDTTRYGYAAGGATNLAGTNVVTTDRMTLSTSTTAASTVSNLSAARSQLFGVSDATTYGYWAGGTGFVATADRITFSSSATAANTTSNLSQGRAGATGISDCFFTYGYWLGGYTVANGAVTTADRITFSTGATAANTVSNLSSGRYNGSGGSDGRTYGYHCGGQTGAGGPVNTIDRLTFATGVTASNTTATYSQHRSAFNSDGINYGYFYGGTSTAAQNTPVVTANRITFSSGTVAANTVTNLPLALQGMASFNDYSL